MPSAEPEANELFDVVILRFETRTESAAERLTRVFGLQPMAAETLLTELPATVRRGVNRVRAEYFRRALVAIGAQVEVHDAAGQAVPPERVVAPSLPPRASGEHEPPPRAAGLDGASPAQPVNVQLRAQAEPVARAQPVVQPSTEAEPSRSPLGFAPARNSGNATVLRGSASPRPFPVPHLDSMTAGAHEFTWGNRDAANDLEPLVLPAAEAPLLSADSASGPMRSEAAYADTPESPLALDGSELRPAAAAPRPGEPVWGELDRGPAPSPRPRARRQPQPNLPSPVPGPIERIGGPGAASAPPLQLQSLPVSAARHGLGESSRPSARRVSHPQSNPPGDGRSPSGPPMLGRYELGGGQPPSEGPPAPALSVQSLPVRRQLGAGSAGARAAGPGAALPLRARPPNNAGQTWPAAHSVGPVEPRSFWECLPEALVFPFLGRGLIWVIAISIWAIAANLLSALAGIVPFAGTTVAFFANTSVIAMCADYHRRCMWAIANDDGELDEGPDFAPLHMLQGYMRSGAQLVIFMAVSQLPLLLWVASAIFAGGLAEGLETFGSPLFWLLAIGPACYWPAAVACASLYNRFSSVWYVPVGVRLIARAPLEYLAILFVGASAFLLPWLFAVIIGKAAALPSAFFAAASGLPLALSHALMGALTGQLMRTRPDAFE